MDYGLRTKMGFTLIEIMVSVSILSVGLILILQGFAHCLNVLRIAEDNLKATLVLEDKMAEAEIEAKEDWNSVAGGLRDSFKFEDLRCKWELEMSAAEWDLEEPPEEYEELKEVKASLSWQEGKREGTIPLVTYMREPVEEE